MGPAAALSSAWGQPFGAFDMYTWLMMALIAAGAGLMIPNLGSLVTATFGALLVFALSSGARTLLSWRDAPGLARAQWNDLLALPVHTLAVYAAVFALGIACAYALRGFVQH